MLIILDRSETATKNKLITVKEYTTVANRRMVTDAVILGSQTQKHYKVLKRYKNKNGNDNWYEMDEEATIVQNLDKKVKEQ